jgi:dUTP pyrophosphatase
MKYVCVVGEIGTAKRKAFDLSSEYNLPVSRLETLKFRSPGIYYTSNLQLAKQSSWEEIIELNTEIPALKFSVTRDVLLPSYGNQEAAGIDFYVPKGSFAGGTEVRLNPGQAMRVASGVKANVPQGHSLICFDKSSAGLRGLNVICPVIDRDYRGEIRLCVRNISDEPVLVREGQKLCQFVLLPTPQALICYVENEVDLFPEITQRGEKRFGNGSFN